MVHATNKTGSSSDDWIYEHLVIHSLLITLTHRQYSAIVHLDTSEFPVAHAIGFSVSTRRFPAKDRDTQTH
jgi:hypothetical protein